MSYPSLFCHFGLFFLSVLKCSTGMEQIHAADQQADEVKRLMQAMIQQLDEQSALYPVNEQGNPIDPILPHSSGGGMLRQEDRHKPGVRTFAAHLPLPPTGT